MVQPDPGLPAAFAKDRASRKQRAGECALPLRPPWSFGQLFASCLLLESAMPNLELPLATLPFSSKRDPKR